jgi:hypothetical protein
VVGRLVEQQDVGTRQQEFGEFHPHEPTPAEGIERPLDPLGVETETLENALDPRLALETSAEFEVGPAVAIAVCEIRGNFAVRVREFLHLALEFAQLPFERREFGKRRSDLRSHRAGPMGIDLLAQYRDANAAGYSHATRVRIFETGRDLQQRGLAGAVGAHQSDPVTAVDGQRDVAKQRSSAEATRHTF